MTPKKLKKVLKKIGKMTFRILLLRSIYLNNQNYCNILEVTWQGWRKRMSVQSSKVRRRYLYPPKGVQVQFLSLAQ